MEVRISSRGSCRPWSLHQWMVKLTHHQLGIPTFQRENLRTIQHKGMSPKPPQARLLTNLTHLVVFPYVLLHLRTRLPALRRRSRFGHVDCRQSSCWYRLIRSDQRGFNNCFRMLACSQTARCDRYPDLLLPAWYCTWSYPRRSFYRICVLALV